MGSAKQVLEGFGCAGIVTAAMIAICVIAALHTVRGYEAGIAEAAAVIQGDHETCDCNNGNIDDLSGAEKIVFENTITFNYLVRGYRRETQEGFTSLLLSLAGYRVKEYDYVLFCFDRK